MNDFTYFNEWSEEQSPTTNSETVIGPFMLTQLIIKNL